MNNLLLGLCLLEGIGSETSKQMKAIIIYLIDMWEGKNQLDEVIEKFLADI